MSQDKDTNDDVGKWNASSSNEDPALSTVSSVFSKASGTTSTTPKNSKPKSIAGDKNKSKVCPPVSKDINKKSKGTDENQSKVKSQVASKDKHRSKARSAGKDSSANKSATTGKETKSKAEKSRSREQDKKSPRTKKSVTVSKKKSASQERDKRKLKHGSGKKNRNKGRQQHKKGKLETTSASSIGNQGKRNTIGRNVAKVRASKGATAVAQEAAITAFHYEVNLQGRLYQSEYSQVYSAKNTKFKTIKLVVKMINLTDCSPRQRANLSENAVRILRYVGGGDNDDKKDMPLSPLFIKIYDIFLISGVKLLIFMEVCDVNRLLYDLVKSKNKSIAHTDVRKWTRAIASGVQDLQLHGVSHRAIKLQHIIFDFQGSPKLCGWSKAVYYYEPNKKRILLQHKERRVRRNYHLPPEAFQGSYDPSKADVWAVGVLLITMSTKRYPFNTMRDVKTKFSSQWREFIKKNALNTYVRNLCHKIFIINPKRRISNEDILADKYFSAADEKLTILTCKGNPADVREDRRVGAESAIDLTQVCGKPPVNNDMPPQPDEEVEEWEPQPEEDTTGLDDNALGLEGGEVGEEKNLSAEEQQFESQIAENAAPEEEEGAAQPEEEIVEAAEEEGEDAADGEEEAEEVQE